ncbi:MAG: hypothetical protein WC926_03805, partial [Candidatus Paceibacterota bacterium]
DAVSKAYWPEESHEKYQNCLDGGDCDEAFLKEINDKNQEFFSIINKASEKPFFVYPGMESSDKVNDYDAKVRTWGGVTYIPLARVLYLSKQGRDKESLDEVLKIFALSKKIREGRPSFINWVESIGLEARAISAAKIAINNSKISSEDLLRYSQEIEEFKGGNRQSLVLIEKAKYLSTARFIDDLHSGKITYSSIFTMYLEDGRVINSSNTEFDKIFTSDFNFQSNRTKYFFARDARIFIEEEQRSCSLGVPPAYSPSELEIFTYEPRFYPNSAGLMLYENVVGGSLHLQECDIQAKLAELQALFALKAYEREQGNMPSSLESIPGYLPEVPKDPYNGKALIYSLEKNIIYSVGRDLTDDGGDLEKDIAMDLHYDGLKDILPAGSSIEKKDTKNILKNGPQGYELEYPKDLVVRANEFGGIYLFNSDQIKPDCFNCPPLMSITKLDNPGGLSLEKWLEKENEEYGFLYWQEKKEVKVNDYAGYKIEVEGDPGIYDYYFVKGKELYSISTLKDDELIKELIFK